MNAPLTGPTWYWLAGTIALILVAWAVVSVVLGAIAGVLVGLGARRKGHAVPKSPAPAEPPQRAPGHHGGPPTRTYAYPCGRLVTAYGDGRRTEVPCQCPPSDDLDAELRRLLRDQH